MFGRRALVAELVDALVSGTSPRKGVGVRVPSWAPKRKALRDVRLSHFSRCGRAYFTVTVPCIYEWYAQTYVYVPAFAKMWDQVAFCGMSPESNDLSLAVTVCATVSEFLKTTVVPGSVGEVLRVDRDRRRRVCRRARGDDRGRGGAEREKEGEMTDLMHRAP